MAEIRCSEVYIRKDQNKNAIFFKVQSLITHFMHLNIDHNSNSCPGCRRMMATMISKDYHIRAHGYMLQVGSGTILQINQRMPRRIDPGTIISSSFGDDQP
jgi:predicted dithiol-disulfide oxidoreductase (DUF899 family)